MPTFGIDISLHQRGIDLAKAKAEGVKFVIIKCSEANFVDPEFENNYKAAKAAGLPVGAYHYTHARTVAEAKTEAEFVINNALKGKQFEYPIFLDMENTAYSVGKARNTENVKAFCDTLEAAGYWAGFYTYLSWYRNYLDASLAKRYSFWLAAYFSAKPNVEGVQMWQFGGNTNLIRSNTIAGYVCDQNYCYVDYPTQIKAKGLNGFKKTATASKPTTATKPATTTKPTTVPSTPTFKVGDHIKLKANAVVYGTTRKWDAWVYNATFFIREIYGSRVVFAPAMVGAITGAVDTEYITKV